MSSPVLFATDRFSPELLRQWNAVRAAVDLLTRSGFQALLAGGSVRDVLWGREPNDFDIATNATPDQVENLFPNALTIGKSFGVTIIPVAMRPGHPEAGHFQIEIATFREDLDYRDGRRPEGVRFSTVEADARRRDFTINAMFYNLQTSELLDFVEGRRDLAATVIRTVGDPILRFQEDHLRILRAVRFSAQLGFQIESRTLAAMIQLAPSVASVSRERVRDELLKLLASPGRLAGLEILRSSGLLAVLFPSLARKLEHESDAWFASFARADSLAPVQLKPELLLALFFKPIFNHQERTFREQIARDLRLDGQLTKTIIFILSHVDAFLRPEAARQGELIRLTADEAAAATWSVANLVQPDLASAAEQKISPLIRGPRRLPPAFLNGQNAKALGVSDGPEMGRLLREGYLLQLEGKFDDASAAEDWLKSQIS